MGRYFGIAAVDLIVREEFDRMTSYQNGRITSVPMEKVVGKINTVNVKNYYDTERYNGRRTFLQIFD
jgi:6-phosphofructokinase 1